MKKTVKPGLLSEQQLKRLSRVYDDFFTDVSSLAEKAQNIASGAANSQPKASSKPAQPGTAGGSTHTASGSSASVKTGSSSSANAKPAAGRQKNPAPSSAPVSAPAQAAELPVATATATDQPVNQPQPQAEPEEDPMETLQNLIGLDTIKKDVKELIDFVKVQKARKEAGLKSVPVSLHLVFTGNPGTGKTTVARIIAKLYQQIGVLAKGQLIEVDRSGLVAGYVGQTAIKTQEQIGKALGGVLFIDEAYALNDRDRGGFGDEAINTIVQEMENHRDDVIVIFAGYPEPMKEFLAKNPGMSSRVAFNVDFDDYTVGELCEITKLIASKKNLVITDKALEKLRRNYELASLEEGYGNGRYVRNAIEEAEMNLAQRVSNMSVEEITEEILSTIEENDISEVKIPEKQLERRIGFAS